MASNKKIDPYLKTNNDTGFGTNASSYGGRFINRDGTFNIRKDGLSFINRYSVFHHMLTLPRWKFGGIIVLFYFFINLLFASLYLLIGINELQVVIGVSGWEKFKEA